MGDSNFFHSEYDSRVSQEANEIDSWEWDPRYNNGNVAVDGKYLEEVDTFNTDGIQGRHIAEYSEQRRPNVGKLPNCFPWGGV